MRILRRCRMKKASHISNMKWNSFECLDVNINFVLRIQTTNSRTVGWESENVKCCSHYWSNGIWIKNAAKIDFKSVLHSTYFHIFLKCSERCHPHWCLANVFETWFTPEMSDCRELGVKLRKLKCEKKSIL